MTSSPFPAGATSPPVAPLLNRTSPNTSNIVFRIPTPIFGAGLIESIPDYVIRDNLQTDTSGRKSRNGVRGRLNVGFVGGTVNTNPNDGGITRFGWKAQNKSLTVFGGEAYNVEQGVTNEMFPNEREEDPKCATNATPESDSDMEVGTSTPSDVAAFRVFMRLLAPPKPAVRAANARLRFRMAIPWLLRSAVSPATPKPS